MPNKLKLKKKGKKNKPSYASDPIKKLLNPITKRKNHDRYGWIPNEEDYAKIERLAGQGLNREQISHVLGVSRATFSRKTAADEKIEAAIKDGRSKAIAMVSNRLFQDALEPRNLGAQVFYLKNQAGWRDRADVELTGKDGGPIETADKTEYTDDERAIRIASILEAVRIRKAKVELLKKGKRK